MAPVELSFSIRLESIGAMEKAMRKFLVLGTLIAGSLAFIPMTSANAFGPVQAGVSDAAAAMSDTIQVKRHKSARPHGWSRGRKVGWRGGRTPPGQRR